MTGRTHSHFRILAKIGEGGMGVVYRAEDEKLRRPVALKVLPPDLVGNEERRLRFLREARAAAAVNHPNIATIYEVGEDDGVVFIAMELVEGKTLRALLGGRPLPLKTTLKIAVEITEALSRAHPLHVVHRDLKPDNIALDADGHVKILDFGLAKLLEDHPGSQSADLSRLHTISGEMTQAGRILGTAAYMSPEQARGESVDARSDLFSFGVVLYEMATGQVPFQGRTNTDTQSAIIRDRPVPAVEVNPDTPAELQRIIDVCLEKDPDERTQHADQLAVDLRKLKRTTDTDAQAVRTPGGALPAAGPSRAASGSPQEGIRSLKVPAFVAAGAMVILLLGVGGYFLLRRGATGGPAGRTAPTRATFSPLTRDPGEERFPALSPDGRMIAYASPANGNWDIYLLRVGGANPINLTHGSSADDTHPAFSPDGQRIAFRSDRDGGGIFVMGATGESVRRLTDKGHHPDWSPDGTEIAYSTEGLSIPRTGASQAKSGWPRWRAAGHGSCRLPETPSSPAGRPTDSGSPTGPTPAGSGTSGRSLPRDPVQSGSRRIRPSTGARSGLPPEMSCTSRAIGAAA
jgi:tRNA A-37 threonylcarbamoyl transferase component Bud32